MLTYNMDNRAEMSLYEYLYACIKKDISEGQLKADEKLPSKRSLSRHLNISVVTVENAYAQLIVEGYIYSIEKRGYFVSRIEEAKKNSGQKKTYEVDAVALKKEYIMDFHTNNVASDLFPFSVWSRLTRSVLCDRDKKLLEPVAYNGVEELRSAICEYLYSFRGISVNAEQIVIGAGTEYLYNLLIQLFGRDKTYAVENPCYKKISKIYEINEVACKHINLDSSGLSVKELEKTKADVVHVLPSHQYPTGMIMPAARRYELLNWANEKDERYIIEDDYDSEFRFSRRPVAMLSEIDNNEKVIYINTFSKTIAPSMRISYMILPVHLMKKFKQKLGIYSCTVPSFEQYILAEFIKKGYFDRHINRMKNYYKEKRNAVSDAIKSCSIADRLSISEENAGLHFLLKIDTQKSDAVLKQLADENGIKMSFLSEYLAGEERKEFEHMVVINYSGIDIEKLPHALEIFAGII